MKFFEYLVRIEKMHCLIKEQRTGTPDEFAAKLGISRTRLYEVIDELKSRGAPIVYSKSRETFFYEYSFDISLKCTMKPLSRKELVEKNGGVSLPFLFSGRNAPNFATVTLQKHNQIWMAKLLTF
ncbi:HTH domain-containing protein [Tenuifilum sp.]|uniref:HTH domain-containing protein n=1 Tax=Tenuifilum sp. TaxID=2760880 RepID=UPI002CE1BCC1|nr:HTH domain-containing protein [Tenuifilum sp.]HQG71387.1 HTH domain-containing protein [Tenuifilum sp.]